MPAFTKEHPFFETCKNGEDGIEVHISKNLVHWENGGYCLKKGDVLGTHGFWAPEVSFGRGKFYMVYSADEHIAVAVSERPTGPFKKYSGNPILHGFDDIVGTGHHSFAPTGDSNKYICIYHCHSGDNVKASLRERSALPRRNLCKIPRAGMIFRLLISK